MAGKHHKQKRKRLWLDYVTYIMIAVTVIVFALGILRWLNGEHVKD